MELIYTTLRALGTTRCYRGFDTVVYCICLAVEDDLRLQAITKEIYMEAATHFGYHWKRVERSLRTASERAWSVNRELLCQMAGYPLRNTPTAEEFVEIVSNYILRATPVLAKK